MDVQVEGRRMRVQRLGAGEPLLLITGLGANLDVGQAFARALAARGFHVIAYDSPGIGGSQPYRRPRRAPGFARTAGALLTELGVESTHVVGISWGGAVAQELARLHPAMVRTLTLAATGPGLGGLPGSPQALWELATPRRYFRPAHYRRVAGLIYGGSARTDPDRILSMIHRGFGRPPTMTGYLGQLYSIAGWSSLPWLWRLRVPTLVLGGDDDPIVPVQNAFLLCRMIPGARLEVIRGGGHLFVLEDPGRVAEIVRDFALGAPWSPPAAATD